MSFAIYPTAKCIDEYISQRSTAIAEKLQFSSVVDPRLETIVEKMFERCFADGRYEVCRSYFSFRDNRKTCSGTHNAIHDKPKHATGIAIESRRMDVVKKCIMISGDVPKMLNYCYGLCTRGVVQHRDFKLELFQLLVELYNGLDVPDYFSMCQCLLYLNDHKVRTRSKVLSL